MEGGHRSSPERASIETLEAPSGEAPQVPRVEAPQVPIGGRVCGVSPSPLEVGSGEGAAPSPNFFNFLWLKIVYFGVYSDSNSHFMRPISGLKKLNVSDR